MYREHRKAVLWAKSVIRALEKLNRAKGAVPLSFKTCCYYLLKVAERSSLLYSVEAMLYTLSLCAFSTYMYTDGIIRLSSIKIPQTSEVIDAWMLYPVPKCIRAFVWNVFPEDECKLPFTASVQEMYYSPTGEISYLYEEELCRTSHDGWDGMYGTYIPDEYMDGMFIPFYSVKQGYHESGLVRRKYELGPAWIDLRNAI